MQSSYYDEKVASKLQWKIAHRISKVCVEELFDYIDHRVGYL